MKQHNPSKARKVARLLREEGREVRFAVKRSQYTSATLYEMPIEPTIDEIVAEANRAILHAQRARRMHARKSKKGSRQREVDIDAALEGLQQAMKPVRRRMGRLAYLPAGVPSEGLEWASRAIQAERRKLWKMKGTREEILAQKPKKRKKQWPN